ncbi:phosphatidylcholine/phosphatidylserine synthase [Kiloniella laminariae]|uniref:Phosphatidylcholine/phosphatidylserine synthase n=1 Tax=Kiloniella laminariae TaxID=454162 RepID=A0ABT4LH81_9PROT|nr:phosphatidylcholine/phosphatidylserine synthase [Kiloniella laminariae]MCZ4280459.1 phosphatidylcholine/phosphatidylserine synthase [Kiloniella laminariae]
MAGLKRRHRLHGFSINRLIPNAITLMALCSGLSAIRAGLAQNWELAVAGIVVAMVLDGLDGPVARLMKGTSEFGAQLDSLADFVNFGVTPALLIYLWAMDGTGGLAWAVALFFAICCGMRLARFNASLQDENPPPWATKFFTGIPAPCGAGLILLPVVLSFELGDDFFRSSILNGVMLVLVGGLFISTIPTYSSKRIRIPRRYVGFVLLGVAICIMLLYSTPWMFLSVAGLGYLVSIILAQFSYRNTKAKMMAQMTQENKNSEAGQDQQPTGK